MKSKYTLLDNSILNVIVHYLHLYDLLKLIQTNKTIYNKLINNTVWKTVTNIDYDKHVKNIVPLYNEIHSNKLITTGFTSIDDMNKYNPYYITVMVFNKYCSINSLNLYKIIKNKNSMLFIIKIINIFKNYKVIHYNFNCDIDENYNKDYLIGKITYLNVFYSCIFKSTYNLAVKPKYLFKYYKNFINNVYINQHIKYENNPTILLTEKATITLVNIKYRNYINSFKDILTTKIDYSNSYEIIYNKKSNKLIFNAFSDSKYKNDKDILTHILQKYNIDLFMFIELIFDIINLYSSYKTSMQNKHDLSVDLYKLIYVKKQK